MVSTSIFGKKSARLPSTTSPELVILTLFFILAKIYEIGNQNKTSWHYQYVLCGDCLLHGCRANTHIWYFCCCPCCPPPFHVHFHVRFEGGVGGYTFKCKSEGITVGIIPTKTGSRAKFMYTGEIMLIHCILIFVPQENDNYAILNLQICTKINIFQSYINAMATLLGITGNVRQCITYLVDPKEQSSFSQHTL